MNLGNFIRMLFGLGMTVFMLFVKRISIQLYFNLFTASSADLYILLVYISYLDFVQVGLSF